MKKSGGVTLIELIIVISIIGVLVFTLGFSFQDWNAAYKIESQIKEMHSDLMHARVMAMCKKRAHFVKLEATRYTIYEDTNPMPDGNNTLETAIDTLVSQKPQIIPLNSVSVSATHNSDLIKTAPPHVMAESGLFQLHRPITTA